MFGDSFRVSVKWVVIISTKQEAAHTQSAKVSTCYTLWHLGDWSLITGRGGYKMAGGEVKFYHYKNVLVSGVTSTFTLSSKLPQRAVKSSGRIRGSVTLLATIASIFWGCF